MADETPPMDEARLAEIRSTIMQALVVGDSDYVENCARKALDELLVAYDRLRAREAAAREMNVSERYRSALQEVLAAQEAYYDLHSAKPLWWDSSYAEALERGAEGEINSLE